MAALQVLQEGQGIGRAAGRRGPAENGGQKGLWSDPPTNSAARRSASAEVQVVGMRGSLLFLL